jgi:hypothetical protein
MDDSSGMRITDLIISREAPLPFEELFVSGSASDRYHLAVSKTKVPLPTSVRINALAEKL